MNERNCGFCASWIFSSFNNFPFLVLQRIIWSEVVESFCVIGEFETAITKSCLYRETNVFVWQLTCTLFSNNKYHPVNMSKQSSL